MVLNSCNSQQKVDLEKVEFTKDYKEILKNTKFQTDAREIVTTLPVAYTKDVGDYKFGTVSFVSNASTAAQSPTVGVLINNSTERITKGLKIEIEDTSTVIVF